MLVSESTEQDRQKYTEGEREQPKSGSRRAHRTYLSCLSRGDARV
jgi:hypothetical protein